MRFKGITGGIGIIASVAWLTAAAGLAAQAGAGGSAKGHVIDAAGTNEVGALVTLTSTTDTALKPVLELTDVGGNWQVDKLPPGQWTVEVVKSTLFADAALPIAVTAGNTTDVGDLKLAPMDNKQKQTVAGRSGVGAGAKAAPTDPKAKKAQLDAKMQAADAAAAAGKYDEAITNVMEVSVDVNNCGACFSKIGDVLASKMAADKSDDDKTADGARAEKYYKEAIAIDPNLGQSYASLASLYNSEHRFDDATAMSTKANELMAGAGGTGNPEALYNQAVIFWNQQKGPEAQAALEKAVAADPKMADAQYLLGIVYVNQNKLADAKKPFQEYLKLEPSGPHADEVKQMLAAIGGGSLR
jgi:hypothetical protein